VSSKDNAAQGSAVAQASRALEAASGFVNQVGDKVFDLCRNDAAALDRHQVEAHGFAWMSSYLEILKATLGWAQELEQAGKLGRLPSLLLEIGFGEYLSQIGHGIAMSQDEIVRPERYGLADAARVFLSNADVAALCATSVTARPELIALLRQAGPQAVVDVSDSNDETAALIRGQFRAFADERVAPFAPTWHDNDELIPLDVITELGRLGVFGLTTPAAFGGSEMGAEAMCVVTEELSRGYIGVGSLGTRSEIACELIRLAGTAEQKQRLLPRLASASAPATSIASSARRHGSPMRRGPT
jgi:(2S)-methylsuccinyl-CoA dehydrogenase